MDKPLDFLRLNNIAAVVIYPDDEIPDDILQKLQTQIGPEYYYIDCKGDGSKNAGVFMHIRGTAAAGAIPAPASRSQRREVGGLFSWVARATLLPGSRRLGGATGSEESSFRFLSRFAGSGQQVARTTQTRTLNGYPPAPTSFARARSNREASLASFGTNNGRPTTT